MSRERNSNFTCRPFTLEGNFLAMHVVHDILLRRWSATPGQRDTEMIRVFPATSARCKDASFEDPRAEGGYVVSAPREGGVTTWLRITASRARVLRVKHNFNRRAASCNRSGMRKAGANHEVPVETCDVIEATLGGAGTSRESDPRR